MREQELVQTKSTLNQKHQEIGLLKHKLEGKEASKHNMIKQYEARLKHMKNELQQLKSSYSKMQKHHAKQGLGNYYYYWGWDQIPKFILLTLIESSNQNLAHYVHERIIVLGVRLYQPVKSRVIILSLTLVVALKISYQITSRDLI